MERLTNVPRDGFDQGPFDEAATELRQQGGQVLRMAPLRQILPQVLPEREGCGGTAADSSLRGMGHDGQHFVDFRFERLIWNLGKPLRRQLVCRDAANLGAVDVHCDPHEHVRTVGHRRDSILKRNPSFQFDAVNIAIYDSNQHFLILASPMLSDEG